ADIASRRRNWDERARRTGPGARTHPPRAAFGRDEGYVTASPQLAASPLHRGHRTAIPRREALILQAALNHPWLLHDRLEELAETEFRHADVRKLKTALIDVLAHQFGHEFGRDGEVHRAEIIAELTRRGFADLLIRIERTITTPSVWGAQPHAAAADVLLTWKQLLALHRQWHSLTRELKDAELALGQDNTETNYSRLRDVKARLSTIDGTEALIEGFGDQSGRPSRSL
ncbi:MAG TPA: DNA primase, partial [Alphaproteobacteria bacterium]|nr:DNA primase [Alphaproteobacteria bacterium]